MNPQNITATDSAAVVRRHLQSLASGDTARALSDYAAEGVIHYPGRNRLSGDHRGHEEVASFFRDAMEMTDGTFHPTPLAIMAGDGHVGLMVRCSATRRGKTYDWLAADVYRVSDGHIDEHWIFEADQEQVDELFA